MREGVIRSFTIKCTIIKNDDDDDFEPNFYFPVDIFENVNGEKAPSEWNGGKFISCVVDPTTMKIIYDVFTMSWKCKGVIRVSMNSRVVRGKWSAQEEARIVSRLLINQSHAGARQRILFTEITR